MNLLLNNCILLLCFIYKYFQSRCNFVQLLQVFIDNFMRLLQIQKKSKKIKKFKKKGRGNENFRRVKTKGFTVEVNCSFASSYCVILLPKPDSQRTHKLQLKDLGEILAFFKYYYFYCFNHTTFCPVFGNVLQCVGKKKEMKNMSNSFVLCNFIFNHKHM